MTCLQFNAFLTIRIAVTCLLFYAFLTIIIAVTCLQFYAFLTIRIAVTCLQFNAFLAIRIAVTCLQFNAFLAIRIAVTCLQFNAFLAIRIAVTCLQFYAFLVIHHDAYVRIEAGQFQYIREKQYYLRVDLYYGLLDYRNNCVQAQNLEKQLQRDPTVRRPRTLKNRCRGTQLCIGPEP